MVTKGFQAAIGEGKDYLLIENVDKSGYVSFIEHTGRRFDLTENQFIMLADRLKAEADKMREKQKKDKPKTTISFEVENDKEGNRKVRTRKQGTKSKTVKSK